MKTPPDIRATIDEVLARHERIVLEGFAHCNYCGLEGVWPCDAAQMALALQTAVEALGEIGQLPVFHDEDGLTIDIAVRANEALAAIASQLTGDGS